MRLARSMSCCVMKRTLSAPLPAHGADRRAGLRGAEVRVVVASSLGTVFEWYDFYLYGSLATIIAQRFFTALDEANRFLFALLAFAAGFAVRPFGALLFGRFGDLAGRKHAFLATIVLMGVSTTAVGLLPTYETIGIAAPILLVLLRLAQGLALGGEYGGAATYVAEHAPQGRRGLYTSFLQTTATLGLILSLAVVLLCRAALGPAFEEWGWRIPFLASSALLAISVFVRTRLEESPVFRRMKEEGKGSSAPLSETLLRWGNLRVVILALFGAVAGQAVVWYTGMFYELFFLERILEVESQAANLMVALALLLATPFFVVFGALSDRIGRKKIVVAGCTLAALTYLPIFRELTRAANPAISAAAAASPVVVVADERDCALLFDPVGSRRFTSSCDVARSWLANHAIPYANARGAAGEPARVRIGGAVVPSFDGRGLEPGTLRDREAEFGEAMRRAVAAAGYPERADMSRVDGPRVVLLLFLLALWVAMVYGPMAAWLVELFPARIRYTATSVPYHLGNGWFGGFLPSVAFAIVAATGDVYRGLWYPIVVAIGTAVVGTLFMPETREREIHHQAHG